MSFWVGCAVGRDVRPAAHLLSFASPKESRQRKSDPAGCVPPLRCGQPAVLAGRVPLPNSLRSLRSLRSNNGSESEHEANASCGAFAHPTRCAPRRIQKGLKRCSGHRCARPRYGSFPRWGKAGMGADHGGLGHWGCPHPYPLPEGEGVREPRAKQRRHPVEGRARRWPVWTSPPSGRAEKRRAWGGRAAKHARFVN